MILLAFLWALTGFALEIKLELGWAGRPILGAVNPLWVGLANPGPAGVRGELVVAMAVGSPWRGEATYTAVVPFAVPPLSSTRLLLPWPVQAGAFLLRAAAREGPRTLGEAELRFSPEPGPLRAGIGPPREPLDLLLSPAELPSDPLLLSPFSELRVFLPLRPGEAEVVGAWRAFLAGEVRVEAEALRAYLAGLRPPGPGWAVLLPGLLLYLVGLGLALPRWAQGRPRFLLALLAVFSGFALAYAVSRETSPTKETLKLYIERPGLTGFYLEVLGIAPWAREELVLEGWWMELLPARGWEGHDLTWRFRGGAWETALRVEPGVPRVLLRLAREGAPAGEVVPRPAWLLRVLAGPWEGATVRRADAAYVVRFP